MLLVSLAASQGQAAGTPLPPPGALAEQAIAAPAQTYVLYLPQAFKADRRWPVLFVFDPRGNGREAALRFVPGAERFGYVIASSNHSRSDGPAEPNAEALAGMMADTFSRLPVEPRRLVLAGFSGTARFATAVAGRLTPPAAAVIGVGAGMRVDEKRPPSLPFAYCLVVGDRDFNHGEVQELHRALRRDAVPHGLLVFEGSHEWPPAEVATRALAWVELAAMRGGTRARDTALVDALLLERTQAARAREAEGALTDALGEWDAIREDFAGLADVAAADARSAALSRDRAVQDAVNRRDRALRAERDEEVRLLRILSTALQDEGAQAPARIAAELGIPDLQKQSDGADLEKARRADRLLSGLFVQVGYYLPRQALDRGNPARAVQVLGVATRIAPERPSPWLLLARAEARRGRRADALLALTRAVDAGLRGREAVTAEPDLAPLRNEPGFATLLARIPG